MCWLYVKCCTHNKKLWSYCFYKQKHCREENNLKQSIIFKFVFKKSLKHGLCLVWKIANSNIEGMFRDDFAYLLFERSYNIFNSSNVTRLCLSDAFVHIPRHEDPSTVPMRMVWHEDKVWWEGMRGARKGVGAGVDIKKEIYARTIILTYHKISIIFDNFEMKKTHHEVFIFLTIQLWRKLYWYFKQYLMRDWMIIKFQHLYSGGNGKLAL